MGDHPGYVACPVRGMCAATEEAADRRHKALGYYQDRLHAVDHPFGPMEGCGMCAEELRRAGLGRPARSGGQDGE